MRVVVLAALIAALPPACGKLLGKKDPASEDTVTTNDPPPPPLPSGTTPPIWQQSPNVTAPSPPTSAPAVDPAAIDLTKAQAAFDAKDFRKAKAILEKHVKAGKCVEGEITLLTKTCQQLKDPKCAADTKKACPPTPNTSNDEPQKPGF